MKHDIKKKICVLKNFNSWNKELNVVSWEGRPPKLDIRRWSPDHDRCSSGITLTYDEAKTLAKALKKYLKENENGMD